MRTQQKTFAIIRGYTLLYAILLAGAAGAEQTVFIPYEEQQEAYMFPVQKEPRAPKTIILQQEQRAPETIILHFGQEDPDTRYFGQNVGQMEQLAAFSGTTVRVQDRSLDAFQIDAQDQLCQRSPYGAWYGPYSSGSVRGGKPSFCFPIDYGAALFQKYVAFQPTVFSDALNDVDLARWKLGRYRNSFLLLGTNIRDGVFDWLTDDALWQEITSRVTALARVAKRGGLRGIFIDPEQYGGAPIWNFLSSDRCQGSKGEDCIKALKDSPDYAMTTFEAVSVKVHQRGRDFIQAINRAFPGCVIWLAYGYSSVDNLQYEHGLWGVFIDGMLEASDPETIFIDGMEGSYEPSRWDEANSEGRNLIKKTTVDALQFTAVPSLYKQKMRVGFGLRMDKIATPNTFQHDLDKAFCLSDQLQEWNHGSRYIFIWHQANPLNPPCEEEPPNDRKCEDRTYTWWLAPLWQPESSRFPSDIAQTRFDDQHFGYLPVSQLLRDKLETINNSDYPPSPWGSQCP